MFVARVLKRAQTLGKGLIRRARHRVAAGAGRGGEGEGEGAPETFSNLFNLGTRRVSESYLRECKIKQSDKQTPFLPPPSREEPKLAGPVWREIAPPSSHPITLMCVLDTSASHSKCL